MEWDQQNNPGYDTCITSYSVSWNGLSYNTTDTNTTVSARQLTGFPFCVNTSVTVTPMIGMGPLTGVSASSDLYLVDPGNYLLLSLEIKL